MPWSPLSTATSAASRIRSARLLAPDECESAPGGIAALRSDDALTVDLAVNPWGKAVPHNDNALRAHIPLQLPPATTPFLIIKVTGTRYGTHDDSLDTPL